jgi:hypothetical protein
MATVSETIPEALQPEVAAALAWFNRAEADDFEVTGILDADAALSAKMPRELRLVLCGGGTCQQRSFRVADSGAGFDVTLANSDVAADGAPATGGLQSELDPPPGARRAWLDSVVEKHEFVVLVFYRGFW